MDYRIYEFDRAGKLCGPPYIVTEASDALAVGVAGHVADLTFGGEVWLADRLVTVLPAMSTRVMPARAMLGAAMA